LLVAGNAAFATVNTEKNDGRKQSKDGSFHKRGFMMLKTS
jgi:hypothetical protein